MINCKECGYRLSDKAKACPNCGAPIEVANPPKKAPVKKKWWEKDCNGWKVGTLISSFLFAIFFVAFLTKINTASFETYNQSRSYKKGEIKKENNLSGFVKRKFSFFKKSSDYEEIERLEKKHKKMFSYLKEIKNGSLSYKRVVKMCDLIEDYGRELKKARKKRIAFDNNKTVEDLIRIQKEFQRKIFPRLRVLYNKVVKMKFFAILRSAVGGKRKDKIIFEATIFANEREIEKFHKIILNDLKKLRFKEVIYILEKRMKIAGAEMLKERKGIVYEIDSPSDSALP